MLTLTSEYGLRAAMHLGVHSGSRPIGHGVNAPDAGIPPNYLGPVLGTLVRVGVPVASPGTGHRARSKIGDADGTFLANTSVADLALAPPWDRREKKRRR